MTVIEKNFFNSFIFQKKFSILEIILLFFILSLVFIIYSLNNQVNELSNLVHNLFEVQKNIQEELLLKDEKLKNFEEILNSYNQSKIIINDNYTDSINIIEARNDMIKFYLKSVGVVIITLIIGFYIIPNGKLLFSFKTLLPSSIYSMIQNNTPFLREISDYVYVDETNNIYWLVKIINNKTLNLSVKYKDDLDYVPVEKFMEDLLSNNVSIPFDTTITSTAPNLVDASVIIDQLTLFI